VFLSTKGGGFFFREEAAAFINVFQVGKRVSPKGEPLFGGVLAPPFGESSESVVLRRGFLEIFPEDPPGKFFGKNPLPQQESVF